MGKPRRFRGCAGRLYTGLVAAGMESIWTSKNADDRPGRNFSGWPEDLGDYDPGTAAGLSEQTEFSDAGRRKKRPGRRSYDFGREFGNYNQDIQVQVSYEPVSEEK